MSSLFACAKKTPAPETDAAQAEGSAALEANAPVPAHVAAMLANFRRVHFTFDSAQLNEQSQDALRNNADIMRAQGDVRVEIQGHADDRGTSEYNISLGDRRAKAVRDFLLHAGAGEKQLETISYGEEKPMADGQDEAAWSKNRRAEFRVLWGQDRAAGTVE